MAGFPRAMTRSKTPDAFTMLPAERKAAGWLASIYALRMFGMFMILPVFALHAAKLPGGDNLSLVGLAMGIYGLAQALMQIPLGWASDRVGRRPVIIAGLAVFALGCILGAFADTVQQLVWARALQGAGAISAALSALLADVTRDEVRSKGMAMIGASIGVTFALSLVFSPVLYRVVGLNGLFTMTAVLAIAAIAVVLFILPAPPLAQQQARLQQGWAANWAVLTQPDLLRLNLGIFMLHLTQMALFVVLPGQLVAHLGLPLADHWQVYLPVVLGSFLLMVPMMVWSEKKAKNRQVKLGAIVLMALVQAGLLLFSTQGWALVALLLAYFVAFNLLEATLPSWVSRVAPPSQRGFALGVYNTSQALGLFAGGSLGGLALRHWGPQGVFEAVLACVLLWLLLAVGIKALPPRQAPTPAQSH
ncbi:MAG: MFS transporter [Limnobacter sp.]|uniref:MFS transporter n=1 Tax=Limnobacter sp. TaxID=2003368 RepID=UPI00391A0B98